ncbi:phosphoesterase [Rhodopirellula sp. MGV]|uniref:phosphoesterase n=1 Tax=Rhodopirellula sp. MGV TaxID=2023130 RepID=UPI000B960D9D|nr:phosphoesterase [Rhodopirellula sp. MGV]OYP34720.1 phosphoesterase [Rhodopirellula sp. MGV]PNY34325.1 phosphoesterase [Rhodopirellula baltica]
MPAHEEHVLVIPASVIDSIGAFEGFETDIERYLDKILSSDQLSYQPRGAMEVDPSFKQLIPYVVLEWQGESGEPQVFTYTRGGGGGEKRLHAKRSIGIGGHISQEDASGSEDAYQVGMRRELEEEIHLESKYTETQEGLIYDPSNEVGQVHLGVVHRFRLAEPKVSSREDDLAEGGFVPVSELRQQRDQLETWSQLALDALYPQSANPHSATNA